MQTAQLTRAYGVIDQVMASNRRDSDKLRGAVVIDAAPALGKTTIATRYARDFHRKTIRRLGNRTPDGHQRLPVVYVPLNAGTTLKDLNLKLLRFYGHPAATRATRGELGALAVDCVQSCQTQVIVIDDLHFIDFKHRNGHEVSNHLKGLANEMPVTFIYVGVRLREKKFFDEGLLGQDAAYAQTSRRATRCEVAPFAIHTTAGARAWTALLAALEQHVLLAEPRPGMLTDHATQLHRRTQGCIGSLTNLLDRVCYLAIATGAETITTELITQVTTDNAAQTLASSV
ncbi:AAA family ATPase [Cellulomonas sp. ATA003]|uniref:AAA family ATPase n=1 Tax=Cellulomonas sp. ATA003 TaxID=3073064 RepID=UPI002873902B|nr:TniB family NTP-binding protein [Cellulomonas sp. ATA003]WNB85786.1 AAA family ATPase [Cellulomonas sp. ATA003]